MGVVGKESMVTVRVVGKGSMIAQASMCSTGPASIVRPVRP